MDVARRGGAGREVDDRVADELAGCVERDVAAARDLVQPDPARGQLARRDEQVLGLRGASERDDGGVLEQEERVVARARAPLLDGALLARERLRVRNEPPPLARERAVRRTARAQSSNSPASSSSRMRNRKAFAGWPSTAR